MLIQQSTVNLRKPTPLLLPLATPRYHSPRVRLSYVGAPNPANIKVQRAFLESAADPYYEIGSERAHLSISCSHAMLRPEKVWKHCCSIFASCKELGYKLELILNELRALYRGNHSLDSRNLE